jgi:hypothetical protein
LKQSRSFLGMVMIIAVSGCLNASQTARKAPHSKMPCYLGRLEKKGMCGQRVICILSADKKGLNYASTWTDSMANKHYANVFTVANNCDFPDSIQEGKTFHFSLHPKGTADCTVCLAYTAVPTQQMMIRVDCPTIMAGH